MGTDQDDEWAVAAGLGQPVMLTSYSPRAAAPHLTFLGDNSLEKQMSSAPHATIAAPSFARKNEV